MSFAEILPLAFVMIVGPQIISAFFFATSDNWAKNSLAYLAGGAASITTFVTIADVGKGTKSAAGSNHSGTADKIIESIVLALVLLLIVRVYLTRKTWNAASRSVSAAQVSASAQRSAPCSASECRSVSHHAVRVSIFPGMPASRAAS